jgi:hypothetical protein
MFRCFMTALSLVLSLSPNQLSAHAAEEQAKAYYSCVNGQDDARLAVTIINSQGAQSSPFLTYMSKGGCQVMAANLDEYVRDISPLTEVYVCEQTGSQVLLKLFVASPKPNIVYAKTQQKFATEDECIAAAVQLNQNRGT